MKQRIYNGHSLDFFDSSNNHKAEIKISGSDLILNPIDATGTVIIGEAGSINDIEIGAVGTAVELNFLGGGTITSNGSTLVIGESGDTVDLSNTTLGPVSASFFTGSFVGDGSDLINVVPDLSSYSGNVGVTGDLTISGNFNITGDINSTSVTDLDVTDKTITVGKGQTEANSGGSGIIVDGSEASLLWNESNNQWDFNKGLRVTTGASGDAVLTIEADTDNNDENDNARIEFKQDGGTLYAKIGLTGDGGNTDFSNSLINGAYFGTTGNTPVQFFQNGTAQITIENGGNVGIGTNNPAQKLTVRGTATVTNSSHVQVASLTNSSEHGRAIINNSSGTTKVLLDSNSASYLNGGNVGIGSATPTDKLDVAGAARFTSNVSFDSGKAGRIYKASNHGLAIQGVAGSENDFAMFTPAGQLKIVVPTGTNDLVFNRDNGKVGIGTAAPASELHIYENSTIANSAAGLTIENDGTGDAIAQFLITGQRRWVIGADNSDGDKFKIASDIDLATNSIFVIDGSNGNVGIGITTPTAKLHVDGTATFTGNTGVTGTGNLTIRNTSGTGSGIIFMDTTWQAGIEHDAGKIHFRTGGQNDRMTIASGGNVSIGTTSAVATFVVQPSETSFNLAGLGHGQIALGNNTNSGKAPTIGSKTTSTGQAPLQFITGQPNTSTVPGMIFSVREDDNSDFATTANKPAYDFKRFTTSLMVINRDGNLGINDTSPDRKVSIIGDSTSEGQYPLSLDATNTDYTLEFRRNGTSEWWIRQASSYFHIHENGVGDRFTVRSGGKVGVGIGSPDSKFHVEQAAVTLNTTNLDNSSAVGLSVTIPDATLSGGEGVAIALGMNGRGRSYIATNFTGTNKDASDLVFYTENGGTISERLRIDQSGDATFAGRILNSYSGTSSHTLQNSTSNGTILNLTSTGDSRTLTLQSDHVFSNGNLFIGNNSYQTKFRGSSYTFETGNATFNGNVTTLGGITIGDSNADTAQIGLKHLLGYCENTDVDTGTEDVKSLPLSTYQAVFFDYLVKNGSNLRAGTLTAVHDGTTVKFNEVSTVDVGNTTDIKLQVIIDGSNLKLQAVTLSDNWTVKANIRGIKV